MCALIEAGKLNEARLAKDKLLADFNSNTSLPEVRHSIAIHYERASNFEEAKGNFQQIIQNHPDSPFANKARLGISRVEAMFFVMTEKFDQAKEAIDKMAGDFAGNPDLPEAIYWTAERFKRFDRFEDEKGLYHKIVQNFPSSPWADKARFALARADITSLIISEKYDDARKALNKLTVDFAGNPELCNVIYWNSERLERQNRFEEAKSNYQKIAQNYPDSPYADRAKIGVARANAMSLIVSGNYDGAKDAIDGMAVAFAGNPHLPAALYWINERYEWADKLDEAKGVYHKIIQNHPDSIYADRARLGIRRVDVMALMESPDAKIAEEALNKMIADFKDNAELPRAVMIIGSKCFLDARAPNYRQRAIKILEKVLYELPKTEAMAGMYEDVCHCTADCYFAMGDLTKALSFYKKLAAEYPEYSSVWQAHYRIGQIYEKLGESGQIPAAESELQTRLAYEQLLRKYPTCKEADSARVWLYNHDPALGGK